MAALGADGETDPAKNADLLEWFCKWFFMGIFLLFPAQRKGVYRFPQDLHWPEDGSDGMHRALVLRQLLWAFSWYQVYIGICLIYVRCTCINKSNIPGI